MIKVKIIRHSERLDFTCPVYWLFCFGEYWADSPLTQRGIVTANNKAIQTSEEGFNPLNIYCSPYQRTAQTANEFQKVFKSQMIIEPLLSEYQPRIYHRISNYPKGIIPTYNNELTSFSFPEDYQSFCKRSKFILQKILENEKNDTLIVTHGEIIRFCIDYLNKIYPELDLKSDIPYLSCLNFDYDTDLQKILISSIKIN